MAHRLEVVPPFRLDLTVAALRRTAANPVDVFTEDGRYLRALDGGVVVEVAQKEADALSVRVHGGPAKPALATLRRMLGTERDLSAFDRSARAFPWLAALTRRSRGMKPPRYPGLFEACVHAIVFQQVSLLAASAIARRLVHALGERVEHDGVPLFVFPPAEAFLSASEVLLRGAGLSAGKTRAIRHVAEALASGTLDEPALKRASSEDAALRLRALHGIGPWSAALILLRGLGRLDVFPGNDSGVRRSLTVAAGKAVDPQPPLDALGLMRGMLYFQLLFARLEAKGVLGRPTLFTD